jgi:hypothetical protein
LRTGQFGGAGQAANRFLRLVLKLEQAQEVNPPRRRGINGNRPAVPLLGFAKEFRDMKRLPKFAPCFGGLGRGEDRVPGAFDQIRQCWVQ